MEQNKTMIPDDLYQKLVVPRLHLWWWVQDRRALSLESVVEGILSYGDMDDVKALFALIGRNRTREIFLRQVSGRRCNYRPQTVNFFSKVFACHV